MEWENIVELFKDPIGAFTGGVSDVASGTAELTGDLYGTVKEGLFTEAQDLLGKGLSLQGQMQKGAVGNVASAFGVSPQMILIAGAIVGIIIIVMVIK